MERLAVAVAVAVAVEDAAGGEARQCSVEGQASAAFERGRSAGGAAPSGTVGSCGQRRARDTGTGVARMSAARGKEARRGWDMHTGAWWSAGGVWTRECAYVYGAGGKRTCRCCNLDSRMEERLTVTLTAARSESPSMAKTITGSAHPTGPPSHIPTRSLAGFKSL